MDKGTRTGIFSLFNTTLKSGYVEWILLFFVDKDNMAGLNWIEVGKE